MRKTYDYLFKILLVGDGDVGKTQILFRFSEDAYNALFVSTIGIDFKIRSIELDGKIVKLQIWDTAGQERFQTISTSYYRGAMGIMLIYDICNAKSFDNIAGYHEHMKQHACPGFEIMLLGNNCHMEDKRQVNKDTGERVSIGSDDCGHEDGSDECVQEDGSEEYRPGNACVVQ
ncbi:ras-related protein Rab-8B-like isoform X2 [Dreissena polymorpha]|uniref:ras-related protein Rab-8B-like isoform X2 n=1 Tax=Dreissena polymorpha TaxID=45954 RepID=UPI002263FD9E|nr:ras-related protein Rab-8B-like isoform X2 [Dreissena polymorpha]